MADEIDEVKRREELVKKFILSVPHNVAIELKSEPSNRTRSL
ncbi:MAG: hypothetical protein R3A47_04080 [Polyangiales bacterium]